MLSPDSCFDIVAREPVLGGHSSSTKEKVRIAARAAGLSSEQTVFLKWTTRAEVVALRAANRVQQATAIPQLIRSGQDTRGDWIATPFYPGSPAPAETDIPDNVVESLATVHAHYLNSGPLEAIPVCDGTGGGPAGSTQPPGL